jgi:hypothetical protein
MKYGNTKVELDHPLEYNKPHTEFIIKISEIVQNSASNQSTSNLLNPIH